MKRNLIFFATCSLLAASVIRGCSPVVAQDFVSGATTVAAITAKPQGAIVRSSLGHDERKDGAIVKPLSADIISDRLLDSIAQIESSGKPTAIGDGGKARGMFQMWRGAWADARYINPKIGDYETGSLDPQRSREAARTYLTLLTGKLQKAGIKPTPADIYAAWNIGFTGYQQRGFDLNRTPKTTQRAIKKLKAML